MRKRLQTTLMDIFKSDDIGCTLKEEQSLRIIQLITRTALYSVFKET